jgi:hypothetical protein
MVIGNREISANGELTATTPLRAGPYVRPYLRNDVFEWCVEWWQHPAKYTPASEDNEDSLMDQAISVKNKQVELVCLKI